MPPLPLFHEYFARRPHYTVDRDHARYLNPATGVAFEFSFHPTASEYIAIFYVDYLRSHVFVLEARPEVAAFIEHFDLALYDPHDGGMTHGTFEAEGMLRGYNHGNGQVHRRHLRERSPAASLPSLPCDEQRAIWRWNASRELYWDYLGRAEGCASAVPRIEFLHDPDRPHRVRTAVRWLQALPLALPQVDLVLYLRHPDAEPVVVSMHELDPHLAGMPVREAGHVFRVGSEDVVVSVAHRLVTYAVAPPDLVRALASGLPRADLSPLAPHEVLDEEVLAAARQERPRQTAS